MSSTTYEERRTALVGLQQVICDARSLAFEIGEKSPVTEDYDELSNHWKSFDDRRAQLTAMATVARERVLRSGIDAPDLWLTFDLDGSFPKKVDHSEPFLLAWSMSPLVTEEWNDVERGIEAEEFRVRVAATGASTNVHAMTVPEVGETIEVSPRPVVAAAKSDVISWDMRAIVLRMQHPDWTDRRIAEIVGVHPGQLSRSRKYQRAKSLIQASGAGQVVRGSASVGKDNRQRLEAFDEDDDLDRDD